MDSSIRDKYTAVIGLEVHAQLATKSKVFSSDAITFGASPNTSIGVVTLAYPGTLPTLNKKALEYAIKMGLACHSTISRFTIFDRKNYFYQDLPKGYQLTQDRAPICIGGFVRFKNKEGVEKQIVLNRIHLEEDAGKSNHELDPHDTLIDFNRAGTALIEIVTDPVLRNSEDASAFVAEVRKMVRYLEICDGNMEEGSLRCDANVSVMLKGANEFGKKVEIKNMNSLRHIQRAIDVEIERQIRELEKGNAIHSETRMFDIATGKTYGMRTKEELNDYRYFPDPDLSPVIISEQWLGAIAATIPPMPYELQNKFTQVYGLPAYDAQVLTDSKEMAMYFEEVCKLTNHYKAASNWIMGPVKSYLNEFGKEVSDFPLKPPILVTLMELVEQGKVSFSVASQQVFTALLQDPSRPVVQVAQELNVWQDSNVDSLLVVIEEVLLTYPDKVQEYKKGKKGLLAMFMGEVMKRSKGKADPKKTSALLEEKLNIL